MDGDSEQLTRLLEYCKSECRICPMPDPWYKLWLSLPDKRQGSDGWDPPLPLILSAWWHTPLLPKMLCFDAQIRYAAQHNFLDQGEVYLRGLRHEDWYYGD